MPELRCWSQDDKRMRTWVSHRCFGPHYQDPLSDSSTADDIAAPAPLEVRPRLEQKEFIPFVRTLYGNDYRPNIR
jgi:hypothetical protein